MYTLKDYVGYSSCIPFMHLFRRVACHDTSRTTIEFCAADLEPVAWDCEVTAAVMTGAVLEEEDHELAAQGKSVPL